MMAKVGLDGGHSLRTSGKEDPNGIKEWSFNNKVLLHCRERLLKTYTNIEVIRLDSESGEVDVPLSERVEKAKQFGAEILVSIHHNANTGEWGDWTGTETFVYSETGESLELAKKIHPKVVQAMGLKDRGIKFRNFQLLRDFPVSVIVEGGFMDSRIDNPVLLDDEKMKMQGYAIADGIAEYLGLEVKYSDGVEKFKSDLEEQIDETQKRVEELLAGLKDNIHKKIDDAVAEQEKEETTSKPDVTVPQGTENAISFINQLRITAGYRNPAYLSEMGFAHYGTDMTDNGRDDLSLYAPCKMKITHVGYDSLMGNTIIGVSVDEVDVHYGPKKGKRRLAFRLAHLDAIYCKAGDVVTPDNRIGLYGNTGKYSSGAHLHLEVDTDVNNPEYSPTLGGNSNIWKAGSDTTINPMDVLKIDTEGDFGYKQSFHYASSSGNWVLSDDKVTFDLKGNIIKASKA